MALRVSKRQIQRQALNTVHNPPSATDKVKVSKNNQSEKEKMVHDLIPFLMMLYKKYMDAEITESKLNEGPTKGLYKGPIKISNQKIEVEVELYGVDNKTRMYLTRLIHTPVKHPMLKVGSILPIPARLFNIPGGGWRKINTKGMFERIEKVDGKYVVYPKSGGDRLGTHDTYEDALNQLQAIEASKARNEDWSEKYKRSIDCNNPKGFSQKAHCQGKKKNESQELEEDLRNWFGKGKTGSTDGGGWDRYGTDGQKLGKCGDGDDGDAYAACLSKEKAAKLGPDGRAAFVRRKRADQKKAGDAKKGGEQKKGQKPTFSKTGASEGVINEILNEYNIFKHKITLEPSSFNKLKINYKKLNPKNIVIDDAFKSQTIWGLRKGGREAHWKYDTDTYELHFDNVKMQPIVLGLINSFNKVKDNHPWGITTEAKINEIPMDDLKDIDRVADKFLNPLDVVITDKHFFDRLNDPRNGKEISQAELIGFFKRLSKHKKQFVEFLEKYEQMVASDDRTNINIPFMKQANKAIAKTIMRKKDFKSSTPKLEI